MFDWSGKRVEARLVDCHDGDTCRVVFDTAYGVKQFIVRLYGVDAPEMYSKDPKEKLHAELARNEFLEVVAPGVFCRHGVYSKKDIVDILSKNLTTVTLELFNQDKYGRTLAKLTAADGSDVAERLMSSGSVHSYFGKTKTAWSWLD